MNAGAFYLHATPPALFFMLYFETGLTKLRRASLWRERERERERAEAGREHGSSGLRLPKYWDYKCAPPRPALSLNFFVNLKNALKIKNNKKLNILSNVP